MAIRMLFLLLLLAGFAGQPLPLQLSLDPPDKSGAAQLHFSVSEGTFYRAWMSGDLEDWKVLTRGFRGPGSAAVPLAVRSADCGFVRVETIPISPLEQMVWVEPGEFLISSPPDEVGRFLDKEDPQTWVRLTRGFWISRYEVTQAAFEAILKFNPSLFAGDPLRPVEDVSWFDAVRYCTELTKRERAEGRIPAGFEYRLPTEAEWAHAARAGTSTRFSYGDDPSYRELKNYAWYAGNSGLRTHPVGQKLPNPWGLYDMHGNIFEWCMDWYGPLPGGTVTDPTGLDLATDRIIRGGYWDSTPDLCRSAVRVHFIPSTRISYLGFRIVLAEITPPK